MDNSPTDNVLKYIVIDKDKGGASEPDRRVTLCSAAVRRRSSPLIKAQYHMTSVNKVHQSYYVIARYQSTIVESDILQKLIFKLLKHMSLCFVHLSTTDILKSFYINRLTNVKDDAPSQRYLSTKTHKRQFKNDYALP